MKAGAASTFILVTAARIARADFIGPAHGVKTAPRPAGASFPEAVRAALALGGKAARETWVLGTDVWSQEITLSPAQTAGLSQEQLARALSFEAEPFSGIPVADGATGFRDGGGGNYRVVQMPRVERDAIVRAVTGAGGRLAGIAHAGPVPEDDGALAEWWPAQPARIVSAAVIAAPAPEPSPHRFFVAGVVMTAAAVVLLLLAGAWNARLKKNYEKQNADFAAASRELDAANKQNETLRKELESLEKQESQRAQVQARRGALLALLNTLATTRPDDVLVRALEAEGASSVIVRGISLEAGAVDELSMVLTQNLRAAGWSAQPRSKTGKKSMANGGPWEFSLALTHEEAAQDEAMKLSRAQTE